MKELWLIGPRRDSPDYIPSTNLTARHRRSAGGSFDSAIVGPFSGQKRGLSQNV